MIKICAIENCLLLTNPKFSFDAKFFDSKARAGKQAFQKNSFKFRPSPDSKHTATGCGVCILWSGTGCDTPTQNPAGGPVRTPPFKDPHESKPWYCWKSSVCSEKKHDFTGTSQASIVHQEGGGCRPVIPSPCGGPQPPSQFLGQIWQLEA